MPSSALSGGTGRLSLQRAAFRARRPAQRSHSLTSGTVCLGKDLLVQGSHAEGCGTLGGARLWLPLVCSISL